MHSEHFQFFLRWIHILAGIAWLGHLYFFNYVNAHFAKTMDAATKQKVVPELMPRALWWFRWGAMITFLSGLTLIYMMYFNGANAPGFKSADGMTGLMVVDRGLWITLGGLFGSIMWFNVWFVIWPRQQKIIKAVKKGEKPAELDGWVKIATRASRMNTYLSGPMLFGMVAAGHQEYTVPFNLTWGLMTFVAGSAVIYVLLNMVGPKIVPFKMD